MLWGIYSAIYGEVNVSVEKCVEIKGDYVEKQQSCFTSVALKSWSDRKLLDPTAYILMNFSITVTDIISFRNIDPSSWITLYNYIRILTLREY